ncbi:MAG: branched-chain-amino-acid transaminase [Clostridiales bacterium]|nr:branched-chain-amino-acid transaminase [Clostridiales bacterium]
MGLKIYLDGSIVDEKEAKVSVFDHGLLYGDGVFEGIRVYGGRVFKLREHIDRLYAGCHTICLAPQETKEEMFRAVLDTCRANNMRDGYIRLVVTRGVGDLGLNPTKCKKSTTFCIAASISLYPPETYENGLVLATVPTRRNINEACNVQVKSLNYLNNIYARLEANMMGVSEAIMLNNEGYVAEATADNVFIVKNGVLITPPLYAGALGGITRAAVMSLAEENGYKAEERLFTRLDMYNADECFLTGTAAEIVPAVKYDSRVIGDGKPGPVTRHMISLFRELVKVDGPLVFGE